MILKCLNLTWSSAWSKKIMMLQSLTVKWMRRVPSNAVIRLIMTGLIHARFYRGSHRITKHCFMNYFFWENGAGGESSFPHTSTNAPLAVGIFNRLRDCASLSTGTICTSVCTSVQCWRNTHLIPHIELSLIALYWLRTGVSLLYAHRYIQRCYRGFDVSERGVCLLLLV